ncbi:MAG: glutamine amidotransferase [Anaerolineae bacterium]
MGACHCDNPDLRQTYTRVPSGLPKIDIAKQAIFQTASVLGNFDYLGVVSFDSSAHWQLQPGPWLGESSLEEAIGGMAANGQTNIYAGLAAAEESLGAVPARVKHIILLTDGWSHSGAYDELVARLAQKGITLSVVAAGGGSATYLAELARKGGGQYYPAQSMNEVPQIFLKETVRAAGNYLIEEPFRPVVTVSGGGTAASPIVAGLNWADSPALLGYNGSTLKGAARVALLTPRGDPLLATWQYGLGRAVAWTSDVSGRWAKNWLEWEGFTRLMGQMVTWSLPRPGDEQLDVAVSVRAGEATLTAQSAGAGPNNFAPLRVTARLLAAGGQTIETELLPSGPQQYQATLPLPAEGVYLAQVTAFTQNSEGEPVASQTTGLVVPYSPEYAEQSANLPLLTDLATATGGQLMTEAGQAFAHTLAVGRQTRPIWPHLLLLAALLFPVDITLRRLRLGWREWQQTQAWLQRYQPFWRIRPTPQPNLSPASPAVQAFRQAQQRTRRQPETTEQAQTLAKSVQPQPTYTGNTASKSAPTPPSTSKPVVSSPPPDDQDTLARLKAAKKRVQR